MSCAVNSLVVVIGLIGLVTGGQNRNYFCDLPCDNGGRSIMNTVCHRQNSMCGKGRSCGQDFKVVSLNDDDRQYILDIHNYLRNKVAMGQERRGGGQPPAANMNTLTYNKELEFVAQCWINECHDDILVHDKCRRISKFSWVGQNLANMGSTDRSELEKVAMLKKLTLGWYDEVEEFHNSWVDSHEQRGVMIGHYTQLVWGDTKELGCAMSFYSHNDGLYKWYNLKLACNYGPGGNWLGQPVYKAGKPGTKCAGRKPNKRFPGLCGVDVSVNHTKNYHNEFFNYHI